MKKKFNHRIDRHHDGFEQFEKIRKGRANKSTNKKDLAKNFVMASADWPKLDDGFRARVVEVHKRGFFVSPEPTHLDIQTKDVWHAKISGKYYTADRSERNFVCVGDVVYCRPAAGSEVTPGSDLPQAMVLHRIPRISKISRIDPSSADREHVLAANADQLLIVTSFLSPLIKWGLIDRYLALCELEGIGGVIVFNKEDLLRKTKKTKPDFYSMCQERMEYYRTLGYKVLSLQANAKTPSKLQGFKDLGDILQNRISLLSGHSGVGKSSIINYFDPEIEQDVEQDSNIFYKGRHTTSYASLIKLRALGAYAIDTPGIRSFVLDEISNSNLVLGFKEIKSFALNCKYSTCDHATVDGCAVKEAADKGLIAHWRYQNFIGILSGETGREGRRGNPDDRDQEIDFGEM